MVLPLEYLVDMLVALAAFISLGVIPVTRQMLIQRRYSGSRAPANWTSIAHVPPPSSLDTLLLEPQVQLQYSPISTLEKATATPTSPSTSPSPPLVDIEHTISTPTSCPHPTPTSPVNLSHATPKPTARSQLAITVVQAMHDLTERPLVRKVKQWWSNCKVLHILHFVFMFLLPRAGLAALFLSVLHTLITGATRGDRDAIRVTRRRLR